MSQLSREQVESALRRYRDPYLGQDLVSAKAIKDIAIEGERVRLRVEIGYPIRGIESALIAALKEAVASATGAQGG